MTTNRLHRGRRYRIPTSSPRESPNTRPGQPRRGGLSYLRDRELQREINSGLNVVESWNYGNSVIFFGKGGDIPGNRRDQQELSVLCLRVLQASIGYLNTLMIQDVLADGAVALTAEDERGLNPLFWSNIAPYGEVKLDLARRITLTGDTRPAAPASDDPDPVR